jgi:Zn-dependent peptidase ImmA (M78 family)
MCGLSLRALGDAIGGAVSHNALAKYEKGEMMPGSNVLLALSAALDQPVDFFFRPFRLIIGQVRFRKKSKFPASRQRAIREQAQDFVERYREAEELVNDVRTFTPPFNGKTVQSVDDAELFAEELRKVWKLGDAPLPNLHELMASRGIKMLELDLDSDGFDGLSAETDAGPVVVIGGHLNKNMPRKRMTEAHELGHVVLPFPEGSEESDEEKAVAAFAGAFLLPKRTFTEAFGKQRQQWTVAELKEIKRQFGVSIMGIMKRAETLGLLRAGAYKRFCILTSQWGWRTKKSEPGDEAWNGNETDGRFRQLVRRAVAEERVSLSKGAALLRIPMAEFRQEMNEIIN